MRQGEIQYTKAGEHHLAWREYVGDGDHEIVTVSGANFPMESFTDHTSSHRTPPRLGLGIDGAAVLGGCR